MPEDYFRRLARSEVFPDEAPLEVDLGCGDGSFLLAMARHHPKRRFLGVERLLGRVRKVCRLAQRAQLSNLKVLRLESLYTVEWLLPPRSVSRLHLLFPDPWPKARHHKRRLVQAPFLDALGRALVPGGEFLFKTDHPGYFEWALEHIEADGRLEAREWSEDAFFHPETDFERQWKADGKPIHQLRCITAS
jgi:tRNA (guanine-N7-)-methyltransferase